MLLPNLKSNQGSKLKELSQLQKELNQKNYFKEIVCP